MSWLDSNENRAEAERRLVECINIVTCEETYLIVDVTPSLGLGSRWSQERFLTIANCLWVESRKLFMKNKHEIIPVIVSPTVATAFQALPYGSFIQFEDLTKRLENISTVYALGVLYGSIMVYVDTMAIEDYAFLFHSDKANLKNNTIMDEFSDVNIDITNMDYKKIKIVGLREYFPALNTVLE